MQPRYSPGFVLFRSWMISDERGARGADLGQRARAAARLSCGLRVDADW